MVMTLLWRGIFFSFAPIHLKALHMTFDVHMTESHATAIRMEVLVVLREK
jgi:hypothetical protein